MKWVNIILSIYITVLSCLPCADMKVNSPVHAETELASNHKGHSHDKENDLCPPFCCCACCGLQIANYSHPVIFDFPIRSKSIKKQLPDYKSLLASNFYGSIWQPPQIL